MPRALNLLRQSLHYRREAFDAGLRAAGFDLVSVLPDPGPGDVLVIWNRYAGYADEADRFEARSAQVLVVENGYLGKAWRGGEWFALAVGHHAGAGRWVEGGPERWDGWGVEISKFRNSGTETVILGQRGIGEPGVRSPSGWAESVQRVSGGRIRQHPGTGPAKPLDDDLASAARVITWSSGAALQALLLGVPVWYCLPQWIGAGASAPWAPKDRHVANTCETARLAMFQRLAWAMWTLDEIRTGAPIRRLMQKVESTALEH